MAEEHGTEMSMSVWLMKGTNRNIKAINGKLESPGLRSLIEPS